MPKVVHNPAMMDLADNTSADLSLDNQGRLRVVAEPFFRIGEPYVIPVSPEPGELYKVAVPPQATSFQVTNPNLFSVRLRGTSNLAKPRIVTPDTGWLYLPMEKDRAGTLMPVAVSVMSVDSALSAFYPEGFAGVGFVELQYGRGT